MAIASLNNQTMSFMDQLHWTYISPYRIAQNFEEENFRRSVYGRDTFLPRNFKLITDVMHDWNHDHENFIRKNLVLNRIWQNRD